LEIGHVTWGGDDFCSVIKLTPIKMVPSSILHYNTVNKINTPSNVKIILLFGNITALQKFSYVNVILDFLILFTSVYSLNGILRNFKNFLKQFYLIIFYSD